jgi:DNA-binding response OmpR family regulator
VLFLSAMAQVDDRVRGLKAGGDDYLTKPFAFAELLARIRALARRDPVPTGVAVSDLSVDELARVARVGGNEIALTRKEFDLLALLAQNAGHVVAEEYLLDRGWSSDSTPTAGLVDVYMSRLRRKLAGAGSRVRIVNLRGIGYRMEVEGA